MGRMDRLSPWLPLMLVVCGICLTEAMGATQRPAGNYMATTTPPLPDYLDGLQCSSCTQLEHLPCKVHLNVVCAGLGDARTEDETLGVPSHVTATRYDKIYSLSYADVTETGINVTFKLPYGFDTPGLLQGFEIKLIGASGSIVNQQICHRMDFSANFTGSRLEQDMTLFFDCLFPKPEKYEVVVTTLPNYREGSSVRILAKDVAPAPYNPKLPVTADRWQPKVKLAQVSSLCELIVTYDQGPKQLGYNRYRIRVWGGSTLVFQETHNYQNDSSEVTYPVNVTKWVEDYGPVFTAKVRPMGPKIYGLESLFSNEVNLTGCSSVPTPKPVIEAPGMSLSQLQLWLLTAGVIIVVAIAACLIALLCRRRKQKTAMSPTVSSSTEPISPANGDLSGGQEQPVDPYTQNGEGGPLKPGKPTLLGDPYKEFTKIRNVKQVLALFWYDNPEHAEVVHSLCMYLEHQCACSIAVSLWTKDASEEWLLHQINSADYVLIINSEGAFKNYKCMITNQSLDMDLNQHNKTFLAGLDHLRKSNIYNAGTQSTNDKFVMIRFSYTSCDHLLPELKNKLCCYHLMHDISSLFLGIHGVPEYMPGQLTYGENINEKDFLNCDEGMELWRAIQVVKEKDGDSGFGSIYPAFADKNPLVPTLVVPPPGGRTTDARYKHSDGDNISVGSTLSGSSCYSIEDEMAKNNESFLRC